MARLNKTFIDGVLFQPGRADFPNYVYNSAAGESAYTKPFFSILSLLFQLSREPWQSEKGVWNLQGLRKKRRFILPARFQTPFSTDC
ncbi:MAG TPA: hypothetical protein VG099_26485 [Gemmataceae bacterium]|jgi:hypothetical protein|nr:hypothetical protein [Gemmataceae bacterium]